MGYRLQTKVPHQLSTWYKFSANYNDSKIIFRHKWRVTVIVGRT